MVMFEGEAVRSVKLNCSPVTGQEIVCECIMSGTDFESYSLDEVKEKIQRINREGAELYSTTLRIALLLSRLRKQDSRTHSSRVPRRGVRD